MIQLQKRLHLLVHQIKCKASNDLQDLYRSLAHNNLDIINQKEIRVAGLRRTGNHAILTWIQEQQKLMGTVLHLNNLKVDENPYRYKCQNLSYYFPEHKWAIEQYKSQGRGHFIPRDCLIYSYEDYPLECIFSKRFECKHDLYLGKTQQKYDLLIIRDPFNLLASRLKNNFLPVKSKKHSFIDLWLDYAREYLGETNYLKHNKICVNYNLWTKDRNYRQNLAHKLNIDFSDAGIDLVHSCGGGSSFEGKNLDGQASKMDVTGRWKHFVNDPVYLEMINHQKLLDYSYQIFGHILGTESLFDK